MRNIVITNANMVNGMTALVEEYGEDYIYTQRGDEKNACVYVYQGVPDCGVGKFLASLGVPLERLEKADRAEGGTDARDLLSQLMEEGIVDHVDNEASWALSTFQQHQDAGLPWGEALHSARHFNKI